MVNARLHSVWLLTWHIASTLRMLIKKAAPIYPDASREEPPAGSAASRRADQGDPEDLDGLNRLDAATISAIHEQYYEKIYRYARYRISSDADAEDIAAEVFIGLLEAVHQDKGPKSSVAGWLMGTVSNLVNGYYRKAYRRPITALSDHQVADTPEPGSHLEQDEQARDLLAAMQHLTEDQQHVLALRFGSGLSLKETAQAIGKKPNAIKQLQFRALAALRRQLKGQVR
jgi:RNA polymerase sigma-70 factor (ECF subfamily)